MRGVEVTSFHGTDACGKSTIAKEYSAQAKALYGEKAVVLGGSNYKEWLNSRIARMVFGNASFLDDPANTPLEKRRLYENIAITTYGYAEHLRSQGDMVAIDSDPFLKRIVWSGLEIEDVADRRKYLHEFNDRMKMVIGDDVAPRNLVGINVGLGSEADLLTRIKIRGGVSEYDPSSEDEFILMNGHIVQLWADINTVVSGGQSTTPGIRQRFSKARTAEFDNPDCNPEHITYQTRSIARTALVWAMRDC